MEQKWRQSGLPLAPPWPCPALPPGSCSLTGPLNSLPRFPPFPISVDCSALENSLQEPEADSSRIFSLIREPFLKLQKCTHNPEEGARCVLSGSTGFGEESQVEGLQVRLDPTPASAQQGPEVPPHVASPVHLPRSHQKMHLSWELCLHLLSRPLYRQETEAEPSGVCQHHTARKGRSCTLNSHSLAAGCVLLIATAVGVRNGEEA